MSTTDTNDISEQIDMDMPWEQLIISGPMTVQLLGQLIVLSSKLDFSFLDYSPNSTFIYMQYPQSFRSTLLQIGDSKYMKQKRTIVHK